MTAIRKVLRRPASLGRRPDDGTAFFPDYGETGAKVSDAFAGELAEEFLLSALSGQEQGEEAHEAFVEEEAGGPFLMTTRRQEMARTDPGYDTAPEAFPVAGGELNDPDWDKDALDAEEE